MMRRRRYHCLVRGAVLAVAGMSAIGCTSGQHSTSETTRIASPGVVGVSPGGVTTRVDVPAESTEWEFYQACHQARLWMEGRQSDPKSLVERYLATVQAPGPGLAGTWNTPWAELKPARQAAVIVAAQAAAEQACD